uniref:1-aminocyclopropane-1-carboxylate synthase n=1 Tax=Cordyceps militaris TaxID=73501 RepID=J3SIN8_CORMI|nr:1-aminocyclopropane-1-carboxylate synthase [Cordyceps militaris]
MLSQRCLITKDVVIPRLLAQFHAESQSTLQPIDLTQAENHLLRDEVLEIVHRELANSFLSKARQSLAGFLNAEFVPARPLEPSHLVLTSGASEAISILAHHLCNAGDGVLLAAPYWSGLDLALETRSQARAVPVDIPLQDIFSLQSIQYYEQALAASSIPIRAILVTNPHNPLGQCYPEPVLEALLQFCAHHGLHYISDEVYALCSFDHIQGAEPFRSITALTKAKNPCPTTHAVYSLSKDFGCSGLRLVCPLLAGNPDIVMGSALIANASVSSLTTAVVPKLLTHWKLHGYINENRRRLDKAYRSVQQFLEARGLDHVPVSAGLCVFARLGSRGTVQEETILLQELAKVNLKLIPGSFYHFCQTGWFRIVFSAPSWEMEVALGRLRIALDSVEEKLPGSAEQL